MVGTTTNVGDFQIFMQSCHQIWLDKARHCCYMLTRSLTDFTNQEAISWCFIDEMG